MDQQNNRKAKIKAKGETPSIEEGGEWSDRDEAEGDDDELEDEDEDEESKEKEQKKISNLSKEADLEKNEDADSDQVVPAQVEVAMPVEATKADYPIYHFKISDNQAIHPKEKITKSKTPPGLAIKQPCILIFDSLAGASRHRIVATLRDYLSVEYFEKKKVKKDFSKDILKGACPRVPQQTNFSDCGIFTLQFAESFFDKPIQNFKLPIKILQDWFPQELVACKRESIAKLIKRLMDQFKPNHGITLRAIKLNQQPNKMDTSEEEAMVETHKSATTLSEGQKAIESKDVLPKSKIETEKLSAHSDILSINTKNGFPSKSRKINTNSKAREIIKVTQQSGSIIIHQPTLCPKNVDYNVSKEISSPVTNICDSKSVRIATVSKQQSNMNTNKVESVVHKEIDQTSCNNVTAMVSKKPTRSFEIRDEGEVLLIFNDPIQSSINNDSVELSTISSETDDSQISTSSFVANPESRICQLSLVHERNPPAISFPSGTVSSVNSHSYSEKTNTSFSASSSDIAFDKLLQSTNHSQPLSTSFNSNSRIIVSQPKYLQCSSSYLSHNSNDPQHIYSRAPMVLQKDNLMQIPSCSLPRFTNTLLSSKIIGSNSVSVPSSSGSVQTYSNNLASDANVKLLATTKLADSSNGSCNSKITEISSCHGSAYTCIPSQTSTSTVASNVLSFVHCAPSTLAPIATQPSFNITNQNPRSKYGSGTKNAINHTSLASQPTAKILLHSRQDSNKINQNFSSSNIVKESNLVYSMPVTLLSQPKLTTVTRSLLSEPAMSPSTQEKFTKISVTQENLPILTSLQSSTLVSDASSSVREKCFYVQSQSQQVATESGNNMFSNSISAAPSYAQLQHSASNSSSGPFSQPCSSSYEQFNSSVSQRLSDSELLLSFASQSSVLSPGGNNIPTTSTIPSSGEFCFSPPLVSSSSTFTAQHSKSQQQQQRDLDQCSASSAVLGSPGKNVSSTYSSLTPASQADAVTRQNSSSYQLITSNIQSQFGHQLASSKSILTNSLQNSTNLAKSSTTITQLNALSSRVSSLNTTKTPRKSRTPARTTSKSHRRHLNKVTLASSCHNTSSVSSTNKTFIGLAKLDNVSGHQIPATNSIMSQCFNSGLKHSITVLSPTNKMKFSSSIETLSKSKTSSVSQSFHTDLSSHIPTLSSQTSLNSPPHQSSVSHEILSVDSQSSKSLNSPTTNSHALPMHSNMLSPSLSSGQLPSELNKSFVPNEQSSHLASTATLTTAPSSYSQFVSSNKVQQVSAPSNAFLSMMETSRTFGQPVTYCSAPTSEADSSLPSIESSVKSNQSSISLSSLTTPQSEIESSFTIPVSPSRSSFPTDIVGSSSQSPIKSMPLTSTAKSNFVEESISLSTHLKHTQSSAPPSPSSVYTPATRTSSGRSVTLPKRFLDSEPEPFINHYKKTYKSSTQRVIKCTKKAKKNTALNVDK